MTCAGAPRPRRRASALVARTIAADRSIPTTVPAAPGAFGGRKQHGAAAAGDVEHALTGVDADLLDQTATEVGEAGWPDRIVLRSQPVEYCSYLALPSIGAVTHP